MSLKYKVSSVAQYMIAKGCVKSDDFRAMLINIMGLNSTSQLDDEKVFKVVQQTNKKFQPYNMMIRAKIDEGTANKYYVLISTVDNEITRAASHYTPKQFELFRLALQAIVGEPSGRIPVKQFKELAEKATVQTTTKTRSAIPEHQALLDEWCQKHWFAIVKHDNSSFIRLGVRSKAELDVLEGEFQSNDLSARMSSDS